ncbi:LysR family transcriptional regulator [Serratia proteamaculans]|jgi:DNA-binding transcriptional LysR family regulator|uniref:LysR family transcriptional regulator n=1 Tax=Serratia proteamaculans TaxID=28151 RepID=A0A7U0RPY4_SERPR|nr:MULTISPECIES: LysR family transcriptional regulator [Serratia]MBO1504488.1 LysR family transcriptional regulator [Serratia proteamaculans]MDW5512563.1 LysR family transcriptional regulator [Serratia proteamaculans]QQX54590.1 LysR family transcriptional regulator [Serratia proteamaculans]CAI1820107.1 D-malate degradation protein R [Serratia proteamaculans]CAI2494856.1 D-malate degradation protein R [Serratia proteamaculans]
MKKTDLSGLVAFVAIAQERSFRRAAARLGVTPPTLSHTMRELEAQVGIRLLNRTTRNVAPTEAGEHLLAQLVPAFTDIDTALESLNTFREQPQGLVRINAPRTAIELALVPHLGRLARDYPGITLEIVAQEGFANIVEQGFDAGIRLGKDLHNDMRAVRVTPDLRLAIVATPEYFQQYGKPNHPEDLLSHRCIGWRKIASGELYKWTFQKGTQALSVSVNSPLILDDARLMLQAALAHAGIAFAIEEEVNEHLATGRLERVLADWCAPFPGFYLYYPNRRNHPVALTTVINVMRYPSQANNPAES